MLILFINEVSCASIDVYVRCGCSDTNTSKVRINIQKLRTTDTEVSQLPPAVVFGPLRNLPGVLY